MISGDCLEGELSVGNYECKYEVIGEDNSHYFSLGNKVAAVEIIDNPYVLYVTDVKQLYNRYDSEESVDVLLKKVYEKADIPFIYANSLQIEFFS